LAQYTSSDGEKTPLRLKSGGTQVVIQGNPRINPTLEVDGTIKIRGGSPTAGKVLTSKDNFGTAEWSTIPRSFIASTPRGSESISYYPADITPTPVVEMTKNDNPAGQIDFLRLHCPAGYIATGGGAKCDGAATRLYYSGHAKPGVPDAFRSNSGRTYSWHQTWIVSCGNQINDIEYMSVTCTPIN
jgi:hypothetical protein